MGPEGCGCILVMKGVFVSALVLRGVCDHVGFLVLCVCISEVSVSWLLGDGVPLWSPMVASRRFRGVRAHVEAAYACAFLGS